MEDCSSAGPRTRVAKTWTLAVAACLSIPAGCVPPEDSGTTNDAVARVELREGAAIHRDPVLDATERKRTVEVQGEPGNNAIGWIVEADSMTVLRVDGVEVMRPQGPIRIERWTAKGNARVVTLEIARCDSIRMKVAEEVRTAAGTTWIRYSTELRQERPLPKCCTRNPR